MELKLNVMEIKSKQEYDDDSKSLVATITLKAKVGMKDLSSIGYLQTVPPPVQCILSTEQEPMGFILDEETGEIK